MKFFAGQKLKRHPQEKGEWWRAKCAQANVNPDAVFTVDYVDPYKHLPVLRVFNEHSWPEHVWVEVSLPKTPLEDYL